MPGEENAGRGEQPEARDRIQLETAPATTPFDIRRHKELTAAHLAYGLLLTFAGSLLAVVVLAFTDDPTDAIELAKTILPFSGTPLALALGYYFGISAR